jgi:hypothetical protein
MTRSSIIVDLLIAVFIGMSLISFIPIVSISINSRSHRTMTASLQAAQNLPLSLFAEWRRWM